MIDPTHTTAFDKITGGLRCAIDFARGGHSSVARVATFIVPSRAVARQRPDGLTEISRKPILVDVKDA